ncbi:bifunctional tRNA (mnm(5)s(2)U34)-methyltransferase/FAD-dependent cmnm(5)s(2)U34 oxidoreductase [Actinobacillus equuli]|nr:bifunctional tRNA (mnm(5)s(2)U34)-methyltransferase/FAD-dependent cmnm(5)s(2)U34 oxidoreductase [Actinobacillus equuli]
MPNGGAFMPQSGWLSPIQFVQGTFACLQTKGLQIVLNHEVKDPQFSAGKWHWQHNGETFSHQILVLANGHTLTQFQHAQGIPLYPVRGQVSQIPTTPALQQLKCVVCYDGYLTPVSKANTHCIGASHVRDNAETDFSLEEHHENVAKLQQNLTACDWTGNIDLSQNLAKQGVRAALRDRVPMVGQMPNFSAQKYNIRICIISYAVNKRSKMRKFYKFIYGKRFSFSRLNHRTAIRRTVGEPDLS